ncbi:WD repeat-containing protein 74-like [Lytechinus pictus]|uniref:WD repeat-containing protein 74-like n=1 Tax=Lytechinus pictus TaxID=7653 RepID=UPI0030B9CB57
MVYDEDFLECDTDEDGLFKGLASLDEDRLITCQESGLVRVWQKGQSEHTTEIKAGANLSRMRQNPHRRQCIATGGKENDLKVWDLEHSAEPIFKAKNVRNDFLDLRVPVCVNDMQFLANSSKIVTCTGHHQVRLYDPSATQRRPVLDISFDEYPLVSMALVPGDNAVLVGNTQGRMAEIDLRKGQVGRMYKGFAGSIRDMQCHPTLPLVASCGLDRFLRVHDIHDGSLRSKIYLKSKLNCLLFSSRDFTQDEDMLEAGKKKKLVEDEEESEEIWQNMKTITDTNPKSEKKKRRKTKETSETGKKDNLAGRKKLRSSRTGEA